MSTLLRESSAIALDITGDDAERLRLVATAIGRGADVVDDVRWVARVRSAFEDTPSSLRRAIRSFRRNTGDNGVLLIRGLPVAAVGEVLGPTPNVEGSVQRNASVPAALLLLAASGLGDPVAFRPEKAGALVQDVVPVPGKEEFQGNAGSVVLSFHNENAFHPHRPDYILLYCLRADHDGVAALRTACVRTFLPLLGADTRGTLFRPEYVTMAPPSFGPAAKWSGEPHAVLFGAPDDPEIRVDMAATRPQTPGGAAALAELQDVFERAGTAVRLAPGDLAVVDNRTTVHGRSAFVPRYDGEDRWLQRTYVLADLRRSRHHRPDDGHVLDH
ncbi:MAG: L-asparagine oxygenase [Micromonosporaceae bacterium]|nr:L-asparagine oxygenase [Micromonosporaceae bacterium]